MISLFSSLPSWLSYFLMLASSSNSVRPLPPKLLIGYATECHESVAQAVRDGVNVVIWSFVELHKDNNNNNNIRLETNSLDLECIKQMIHQLDEQGYDDTVHLVSFGGWNGPHLDSQLDANEFYQAWKEKLGHLFHGVDWDLEGHDDLESSTNTFTIQCLDTMGKVSELAHQDGYIIGLAPPQSYLDIEASHFSRRVNWTDPSRSWHADFHYFGRNVYAYLLSKYGHAVDFVSIQFYESWSRAGLEIQHLGSSPSRYLQSYNDRLMDKKHQESFWVDFDQDVLLNYPSRRAPFPRSKLVWGLANGWALDTQDKALFIDASQLQHAYQALASRNHEPRGLMFWVIGEEGKYGIHYTKNLNQILNIRTQEKDETTSQDL